MNEKEILLGYVAKTQGISEDAAAELLYQKSEEDEGKTTLKTDGLTVLLAKDKERVNKLKADAAADAKTTTYDEAYNDAKKKVLAKAEKKLADKYGIEGDGFKLETLVADIIKKESKGSKGKDAITDDDIKKHPVYLEFERAKTEELKALEASKTKEIEAVKADYLRTETLVNVKKQVLTLFDTLNPVLSKDATKASNQRNDFSDRFNGYEYQLQENGEYLILKDGKRLEDGHGNPKSLKSLVEENAGLLYDFKVQGEKGGAGNGNGNRGGSFEVPKNEEEYNKAMLEAKTPEERQAINDAFNA